MPPLVRWMMNQSIFCVVCCDMFLSTASVILVVFYFFDTIVLETPSVSWIRNQSIVFVVCQIFYHMDYPWLHVCSLLLVLNRTDPTRLGIFQL